MCGAPLWWGVLLVLLTACAPHSASVRPIPAPADVSTVACQPTSGARQARTDIGAPPGWVTHVLPARAAAAEVVVLSRPARVPPARYRVLVIPGSGCTRWAPIAERYFAGLLHADVVVLHKPHVDVTAGWHAPCTDAFIANDALDDWRDTAVAAVATLSDRLGATLPWVVVGISEGAELLPAVAAALPAVSAVVMVSASGLDPAVAGTLQAQRVGHVDVWQAVQRAQASAWPDDLLVQGRTLRYWRALWQWSLADPLMSATWPLLRVWGDADLSVPPEAYWQFSAMAATRQAPFCDIRLPGADHGLQTPQQDGIQWLWSQLERWARQPESPLCDVVRAL